jgi:hypothetical protein
LSETVTIAACGTGFKTVSALATEKNRRTKLRQREQGNYQERGQNNEFSHVDHPLVAIGLLEPATCGPRLAGPQVPHAGQVSAVTSTTASAKA